MSASLPPRQREALRWAALGLQDREIAARMEISQNTVLKHLHFAYLRLGVESRIDAFRAVGWLRVPSHDGDDSLAREA